MWYYYSGKTVRPIPVKKGLSKSVRPNTKIEILEETVEVAALIRSGQLRITGRPPGAPSVAEAPVPQKKIEDVLGKSELAKRFAEKGKTKAAGIPPVSIRPPELTEAEAEISVEKTAESTETPIVDEVGSENVDQDEELKDVDSGKIRKRRR